MSWPVLFTHRIDARTLSSVCVCACVCVYVCVCVCRSLSVCLSLSLCLSVFLCLSVCLSVFMVADMEEVERRHAALARCLADIIHSHSGVKVFIEQEVAALTRVVNGQTEHARMDLVFNLNGSITYLDVSIVAPFSCNPSLVSAASTKPGLMAKRAEKTKFDRYPHINLVPFILETTGRPGPHARKFINYLLRDADNPPIAVRDTWSTIQSVLHSAISKQQLTAAVT